MRSLDILKNKIKFKKIKEKQVLSENQSRIPTLPFLSK